MNDEEAFWRAIDAAPGDMTTLMIFADWMAERGDPRERCLRWCVRNGKRPTDDRFAKKSDWWIWVDGGSREINSGRMPTRLFVELEAQMARYEGPDCISAAYRDLCEAWLKVTAKAREKRRERLNRKCA